MAKKVLNYIARLHIFEVKFDYLSLSSFLNSLYNIRLPFVPQKFLLCYRNVWSLRHWSYLWISNTESRVTLGKMRRLNIPRLDQWSWLEILFSTFISSPEISQGLCMCHNYLLLKTHFGGGCVHVYLVTNLIPTPVFPFVNPVLSYLHHEYLYY